MSSVALILSTAAKIVGVPPALLLSICFVESSHINKILPVDGGSASYGICMVKYATAKGVKKDVRPSDLLNPEINALVAALYLKRQLVRYHGDWSCAARAFNRGSAGPACLNKRPSPFLSWGEDTYAVRVAKAFQESPWKR